MMLSAIMSRALLHSSEARVLEGESVGLGTFAEAALPRTAASKERAFRLLHPTIALEAAAPSEAIC